MLAPAVGAQASFSCVAGGGAGGFAEVVFGEVAAEAVAFGFDVVAGFDVGFVDVGFGFGLVLGDGAVVDVCGVVRAGVVRAGVRSWCAGVRVCAAVVAGAGGVAATVVAGVDDAGRPI